MTEEYHLLPTFKCKIYYFYCIILLNLQNIPFMLMWRCKTLYYRCYTILINKIKENRNWNYYREYFVTLKKKFIVSCFHNMSVAYKIAICHLSWNIWKYITFIE